MIIIGSPPVNRGVAVLDDRVFFGTAHGHLIALDAKSGVVRWDAVVDDNKQGYYLTLAPPALNGRIFVGVSGAEAGIRGFVDAYDPQPGKRLWRTHTIPAPGEPGSESWARELEDGRRFDATFNGRPRKLMGVAFGGSDEGNFFALDADNGRPLWDLQLGATIRANPISLAVDGRQYVAIAARYSLYVFGLP